MLSPAPTTSLSPVVNRLCNFLDQDPTNFEITILPQQQQQQEDNTKDNDNNKEEVFMLNLDESIVLVEGKYLGLDAQSLPWITRTIRKDYKNIKQKLLLESSSSTNTTNTTDTTTTDTTTTRLLLMVTSCLLLVNPDHSTAWADRRRCLHKLYATTTTTTKMDGDDDNNNNNNDNNNHCWYEELKFLNLLMTQHSKAPSSWGHRKYILQQILKGTTTTTTTLSPTPSSSTSSSLSRPLLLLPPPPLLTTISNLIQMEIDICQKIAERYPKNYYAWTHRRFLWTILMTTTSSSSSSSSTMIKDLLQKEYLTLFQWLNHHISDHSAVHYLCQVLQLLLQQQQQQQHDDGDDDDKDDNDDNDNVVLLLEIAKTSLEETKRLIKNHPNHESLWILRRMINRILLLNNGHHGDNNNNNDDNDDDDDNDNVNSLIQSLVWSDIDKVYNDYVLTKKKDDEGESSSSISIHAWTFLLWCMVNLESTIGGCHNNNNNNLLLKEKFEKTISVIQSNSNSFPYEIWKSNNIDGPRIMF